MKTLSDADVQGKIVLVRVDYNVPIVDGEVESDLRIRASIPTLKYLLENGAKKIVLISHLGRPDGEKKAEFSLKPVALELEKVAKSEVVDAEIKFVSDTIGEMVKNEVLSAKDGSIVLLENLRFYPGEEENSDEFAKAIIAATHAEVFVQDGFAVIHRAHASTSAITKDLPSFAGFLVEKEVKTLKKATENPEKPVLVIIGGAKVDDKKPLIEKFLPIADNIVVAGKIAADGYVPESEKIYVVKDFVLDENGDKPDMGEESVQKVIEMIDSAKTIVWNGTVGVTEKPPYDKGSRRLAEEIGRRDMTSIICGGDTTGFVLKVQKEQPDLKFTLVSTGGGASLELLSGLELPGLTALE
jgi:3-phosphoglycerate kinase